MALGNNDNIIIHNNVNLDAELKAELEKEKAKVKELTEDVNRYIEQWHEATAEVEHLNEVIAQLESDSGVDILKDRIRELTRATSSAAEEFEGFLRYAHLIDEDGFMADDRLYTWFEAVKEGAITAGQAIANVKVEFGEFIRETMAGNGSFDSQMVQQFTTTLTNLSHVIDDIYSRLIGMQENGVTVASGDGLGGTFSTIDQIRESVENMSEEAREAYQPITQLVEKIVELTTADSTKMLAISQAFRSIAEFGRGSFGSSKVNNVIELVRQLHTITSSGNNVIRFELTGLNDLHVSKASMRNLAEYLPTIASVNAAELERLSHVDLTNFNDIKVSKVALESIAQLRGALDQLSDAGVVLLPPGVDAEMVEMLERLSSVKKLMSDINNENKKIQSSYSKAVGALGDSTQDENDRNLLTTKYDQYMAKLTTLRQNKASATAEDIQEMHAIQAELNEIIARIQARINIENVAANASKKAAAEKDKEAKQDIKNETDYAKMLKQVETLRKRIITAQENWTKSKSGKTSLEYNNLSNYNRALDELAAKLSAHDITAEEFKQKYTEVNAEFARTSNVIHAAGEDTKTFADRIKGLAAKFSAWLSASQIIMFVVRALKKMVSTAIEIDSAMTQLRIVTNATNEEMKKFGETTVQMAKDLGKSVTDLTKSIETFSRLGYNLTDSAELAKYATIMSNVAGVGSEEATTGMTSIIKGFNLDVADAEHVADILVNVGQKYAVSAGEMMEAYEKSGAALHATNTSLEKSAGLIAAANASVQDASVIGTALKTVSARIRGSKSDLEELGESTDDLAEGFSKYAEEIKALTGFDIMVDETHFKDLFDMFDGISQVWDKLSDTQQARVSEIFGGTRQLQVISSIIGNWKDAANAYGTAMNSAGVSTKANATYMESMQAHIDQLKATFEELSMDVVNDDAVKGLVDILRNILQVIDGIVKSVGALPPILAIISGYLSAKNIGRIRMFILSSNMPIAIIVPFGYERFKYCGYCDTVA